MNLQPTITKQIEKGRMRVTMTADLIPRKNKLILKTKNVEIEEFDIWADPAKAKEMLQRTNGARTIPQIFIGDHYIGGNDKLQEANRSGELDKLLA